MVFWRKKGFRASSDQVEKIATGYEMALEQVDGLRAALRERSADELGAEPSDLSDWLSRIESEIQDMKARLSPTMGGWRADAEKMKSLGKDMRKLNKHVRFFDSATPLGCDFAWAVLDTQADFEEQHH